MKKFDVHDYLDIIDKEKPKSKIYKPMSIDARAAQFAPFAALKGHSDAINDIKEAVVFGKKIQLDEQKIILLDETIQKIKAQLEQKNKVLVKITYYQQKKEDIGIYQHIETVIHKIDDYQNIIKAKNHLISIDDIYDIEIMKGEL